MLARGSRRIPPVPPGFSSLTSFALRRLPDHDQVARSSAAFDELSFRNTLSLRPWLDFGEVHRNSEAADSDSERSDHDVPLTERLPRGVTRGCSKCPNCQKVTARWRPEEARRPALDEAPTFYPSEEEFEDTLKYIASIRPLAEPYGICRIVPPSSWKPPCTIKENVIWQNSKLSTSIQYVDKLQSRYTNEQRGRDHITSRKRQRILYNQAEHFRNGRGYREMNLPGQGSTTQSLPFKDGPTFTLEDFEMHANDFLGQYFNANDSSADLKSQQSCLKSESMPSVEDIEGEYWRIVEKPTEEIEVLHGANVDTKSFSSGFPKTSSSGCLNDKYLNSGWNLNNTPRLPGSMLSFENGDIQGVTIPQLHVGMCFTSFCWHVEQYYMYSLKYLHLGASNVWYGVPGRHAPKVEESMKKHLSSFLAHQPHTLYDNVTQLSPSLLKLGVPVYRCIQRSGEFVLTFPQAYHCGFSCGFNCTEAVNVAPIDWLCHGQNAAEIYHNKKRMVSVSYDKLLFGAAREAVRAQWNISFLKNTMPEDLLWRDACGLDKALFRAFEARLHIECKRREFFCHSLESRKIDSSFDANEDRRCVVCHCNLYLSAIGCSCSLDKFACVNHAKQMCQCSESVKFFLSRYAIRELNTLTDALGGKLSAVHKWAISDLGLSLNSCVSVADDQDLVVETSLGDSMLSGDGKVCDNLQKKLCTDQASGAHSVMPIQDHAVDEIVSNSSAKSEGGVKLGCYPEKVIPRGNPDPNKDPIRGNDAVKLDPTSEKIIHQTNSEINESALVSSNTVDLQKGHNLAKVIQRNNFVVELLQHGNILPARLWSTSQAIFPKGYKSRIKYFNVKNPSQMCDYASEILDAGLAGPLFMVQLEQCPSELFIHTCPARCWDMVRERVNQEIRRQHSYGNFDVPPPQPPGSVDGFQMYGLTSPTIVQEIEALDTNHVCSEYWKHRSCLVNSSSATAASESPGAKEPNIQPQQEFSKTMLRGLFKKANREELDMLHRILGADQLKIKQEAIRLVGEEIVSRSRSTSGKS